MDCVSRDDRRLREMISNSLSLLKYHDSPPYDRYFCRRCSPKPVPPYSLPWRVFSNTAGFRCTCLFAFRKSCCTMGKKMKSLREITTVLAVQAWQPEFKHQENKQGPVEKAQWLRALAGLPEVLSPISSNHMVAHNHPYALFWCAVYMQAEHRVHNK